MVAIVLFGTLVIALILNMPVGIAIGLSSLCAVLADGRLSSLYIVQQLVTSADSFPLMAIPLFILAGELWEQEVYQNVFSTCATYFWEGLPAVLPR